MGRASSKQKFGNKQQQNGGAAATGCCDVASVNSEHTLQTAARARGLLLLAFCAPGDGLRGFGKFLDNSGVSKVHTNSGEGGRELRTMPAASERAATTLATFPVRFPPSPPPRSEGRTEPPSRLQPSVPESHQGAAQPGAPCQHLPTVLKNREKCMITPLLRACLSHFVVVLSLLPLLPSAALFQSPNLIPVLPRRGEITMLRSSSSTHSRMAAAERKVTDPPLPRCSTQASALLLRERHN